MGQVEKLVGPARRIGHVDEAGPHSMRGAANACRTVGYETTEPARRAGYAAGRVGALGLGRGRREIKNPGMAAVTHDSRIIRGIKNEYIQILQCSVYRERLREFKVQNSGIPKNSGRKNVHIS